MKQQEQLTKLIERALENRWENIAFKDHDWKVMHLGLHVMLVWTYPLDPEVDDMGDPIPEYQLCVPNLLFGDNLRFLEALVGESYQQDFQSVLSFTPYQWAAQHLVLLPDAERIPWLYEVVFSNK